MWPISLYPVYPHVQSCCPSPELRPLLPLPEARRHQWNPRSPRAPVSAAHCGPDCWFSSSKLGVWWRLIPLFSSFKSTHPSPVILEERIPEGANLSNNGRETKHDKQTNPETTTAAAGAIKFVLEFPHLWVLSVAGPFVNWREHDMFVQRWFGACLSPRFFPALFVFSLWCWNAQIAFLRC